MGLDISGWDSKKSYHCGYSGIHQIRWLASIASGAYKTYAEFYKLYECGTPMEKLFPNFEQLMHFSDAEGILVPSFFLRQVEYKNSYHLGNSEKLLAELKLIKLALKEDKETFEYLKVFETRAIDIFEQLYDLVLDEVEEGTGILKFH